ncbi:cytochrome c maturation protein CcmE [Marinibactrum halimedae]|uniref:Cytochrome c-type biogenesis protein CcmE n=1 Tax=Marinibactrum halimedae TaxID=1444977 RepID=A0AA37TC05_9GAMM|nr:cytochrome c maturation protein CcmE [Marinibactrum halimedae]MCD9460395.1 cytochrome c maturation protein CcmE [Marinibactrum halimedae]GLS27476.1 cytochrome c-type biogenesis protein CcmE [Marinibactrum halimedae]
MHPVRKQRLIFVVFVVVFATVAIGLMVFALRENMNLFYPPSKIAAGEAPVDKSIRAGGCVMPGTVKRSGENLDVNFLITDGSADVKVFYSGILPDLFAEGEAVVVNGKLSESGDFNATEVLAKHDENYMPPEVADAMAAAGNAGDGAQHQKTCEVISYDS